MTTNIVPLIYFTHAELKSSDQLSASFDIVNNKAATQSSTTVAPLTIFDSGASSSRAKRIKLSIHDENMSYEGVEEDEQPFHIAIVDKSKTITSVCRTPYFIVRPECYLRTESTLAINAQASAQATYSEKLNSLTAAFGSSKRRKAMQTKIKNKIDSDTLEVAVSAAVEEAQRTKSNLANDNDTNESDDEEENGGARRLDNAADHVILPVANKSATKPHEVYPLRDLFGGGLGQQQLDAYTSELATKFATASTDTIKQWLNAGIYANYICERLNVLASSSAAASASATHYQFKMGKCRLLALVHFLLTAYGLKPAQLRAKRGIMSGMDVPDAMVERLLDAYTCVSAANAQARSVRSMPRRLKDKLVCHILVVALHVDDFATQCDTFQRDLKLSMQRLVDFYQTLGCHVKTKITQASNKKSQCKLATLTLPLFDAQAQADAGRKKRARN